MKHGRGGGGTGVGGREPSEAIREDLAVGAMLTKSSERQEGPQMRCPDRLDQVCKRKMGIQVFGVDASDRE